MTAISPPATIGFLGGGQLARMMVMEARRLGYRTRVLDPAGANAPAAQISDSWVEASLDDASGARRLGEECDIVTLDTEHVPADVLRELEEVCPVRPGAAVLGIIQDRGEQRAFVTKQGVPQPAHALVRDEASLARAAEQVGFPCVLKTARSGYDGRGQVRAKDLEELTRGWVSLGRPTCVLEEFVDFDREISVHVARGADAECSFFPLAENVHRSHILHRTCAPARVSRDVEEQAKDLGRRIAEGLDYRGILAVELFLLREGRLLLNEIAPRPHNAGHFTLGGCVTSQFEQHLRAVCGQPLGDPSALAACCMLNLLGDLWEGGEPDWTSLLAHPSALLHLYGKADARPGRKMGHVLFVDRDPQRALEAAASVARSLGIENGSLSPNGTKE